MTQPYRKKNQAPAASLLSTANQRGRSRSTHTNPLQIQAGSSDFLRAQHSAWEAGVRAHLAAPVKSQQLRRQSREGSLGGAGAVITTLHECPQARSCPLAPAWALSPALCSKEAVALSDLSHTGDNPGAVPRLVMGFWGFRGHRDAPASLQCSKLALVVPGPQQREAVLLPGVCLLVLFNHYFL